MIRGTNKRIIEINGEDGSCFERIVLFLRPDQDEKNEERVLKMAEDYADGLFRAHTSVTLLSRRRLPRIPLKRAALIVFGVLAAVGVAALCFAIL